MIEKRWYIVCDFCGQRCEVWHTTKKNAQAFLQTDTHSLRFRQEGSDIYCSTCYEDKKEGASVTRIEKQS